MTLLYFDMKMYSNGWTSGGEVPQTAQNNEAYIEVLVYCFDNERHVQKRLILQSRSLATP